jgi:hypothetical protein
VQVPESSGVELTNVHPVVFGEGGGVGLGVVVGPEVGEAKIEMEK